MANSLPARPNLDHLRSQAKALLADLKAGRAAALGQFTTHLPAARQMTPAKVKAAGFTLADAQSVVARRSGFDSWPVLARHVEHVRALEGEWHFVGLQVDGNDVPASMTGQSRLMMDGAGFRMESPEANYDGTFTIDAETTPMRIDIAFVEGPEAGNTSLGIFELSGDQLTMCLGLTGATRPMGFSTSPGSGHALERLRRASAAKPKNVTGGTPERAQGAAAPAGPAPSPDAAGFDVAMTPLLQRLEGEWVPAALVRDGQEMPAEWLAFGKRTAAGNEVKVIFGGQVMVHAKVRIDEHATPMPVDYLNLAGGGKGKVSLGIMDWIGDEVRFLMASPGEPRPSAFTAPYGKGLTFSQWRKP